jgi:outer membrane lipopolysaccharide assembly protein LptE/RlpB
LVVAITAVLSGCGYHFAGSGSLPAGVSTVFIVVMENRTVESGVERVFTNDLIDQFTRRRKASLAETRDAADGILSGTIVSLNVQDAARSSVAIVTERQLTCQLIIRLSSPEGRILWSSGTIVERQTYSVADDDNTGTNQNKVLAIAAVSKKATESAFYRLTADF